MTLLTNLSSPDFAQVGIQTFMNLGAKENNLDFYVPIQMRDVTHKDGSELSRSAKYALASVTYPRELRR